MCEDYLHSELRYRHFSSGSLLIPIIMSKLPNEIRLEIVRKLTANVWKIEELLKTIKSEIEARETSEAIKAQEVQGRKHNHGLRKFPPTANALVSIQGKDFQLQCVYCSGEHYSASCTKAQLPKDRKEILQRANRCFIFLKTGHEANSCFKTKKSRNCDGKHHQSICLESNNNSPRDKNRPPSSTSGEQNDKDTENNGVTTATSNLENTNSKRRVFLQTVTAIATNDEGTKSTKIRLLFDNDKQMNSLKGFWETESIDFNNLTADGDSKNESFEIDVNRNGDRYEVKLPWKGDCRPSSNGYQLCAARLRSLHHKLRKEPSKRTTENRDRRRSACRRFDEQSRVSKLLFPTSGCCEGGTRNDESKSCLRWVSKSFQRREIIERLFTNWTKLPSTSFRHVG